MAGQRVVRHAQAAGGHDVSLGAFLDIGLDFIFYAAVVLGFALANPNANALPLTVKRQGVLLGTTPPGRVTTHCNWHCDWQRPPARQGGAQRGLAIYSTPPIAAKSRPCVQSVARVPARWRG